MNRQLKRVSVTVLLMFTTLMVALSLVQVLQADTLRNDGRNVRALAESYNVQRGAIVVAGQPIVESVPSDDMYKYQRVYHEGELYSSVTGFLPISGAPTGIEGALNDELRGGSSSQFFERINAILTGKNPQGASVELTLDPVAQRAAFDALGDLQGAVVLLNVKTGEVLAMVSKPGYDPNVLANHDTKAALAAYDSLIADKRNPLINKALRDLNPPGSTFKLVVAAAALSSGMTPETAFPNPAVLPLPLTNATVRNSGGGTCGGGEEASIATAIVYSCNIPMAQLGMTLGSAKIADQAELFGFNHSFSLPMAAVVSRYPIETDAAATAMSAFGQRDVRASALQMALVSSAIAHQGVLMEPQLVRSIRAADFTEVQHFEPKEFARPVNAQTAQELTAMMVDSVRHGAATNARIEGVSVAGKTGTAQHSGDIPYTLWFTGFAPSDDPEFAVAVVVEDGGGRGQSGFGNTIAAPIARQVLEAVLNK